MKNTLIGLVPLLHLIWSHGLRALLGVFCLEVVLRPKPEPLGLEATEWMQSGGFTRPYSWSPQDQVPALRLRSPPFLLGTPAEAEVVGPANLHLESSFIHLDLS